jgi:hypothetical protein
MSAWVRRWSWTGSTGPPPPSSSAAATSDTGRTGTVRPTAAMSSRPSSSRRAARASLGSARKSMAREAVQARIEIGVPKFTQA